MSRRNRNDKIIEKLESDLDIEKAKIDELISERCVLKNQISQLEIVAFKVCWIIHYIHETLSPAGTLRPLKAFSVLFVEKIKLKIFLIIALAYDF